MKSFLITLLTGALIHAETYQYEISGMHCGSCKKAVSSTVCKIPGIKTCNVSVGSMTLTSEDGKTLDQAAITKAVTEAAEKFQAEYKISSSKKKD